MGNVGINPLGKGSGNAEEVAAAVEAQPPERREKKKSRIPREAKERGISHPTLSISIFCFWEKLSGRMRLCLEGAGESRAGRESHHATPCQPRSYYINGIKSSRGKPLKYFHDFPTKRSAISPPKCSRVVSFFNKKRGQSTLVFARGVRNP